MGSTSMHWRNRPGLSRLPEATVFSALGLGSQSAHSKQSVGILLQSSVTRWEQSKGRNQLNASTERVNDGKQDYEQVTMFLVDRSDAERDR